jgi:hypothetical protein
MSAARAAGCCVTGAGIGWAWQLYSKMKDAEHNKKCAVLLDSYVRCMKGHEGERPAPYALEWCYEEREAYRAARGLDSDESKDYDDDV